MVGLILGVHKIGGTFLGGFIGLYIRFFDGV